MNERKVLLVLTVAIILFGIYQVIRPEPIVTIEGNEKIQPYKKGNHPLQVYTSESPLELRKTPDILAEDNKAGHIEQGDIFAILKREEVVQTIRTINFPKDNAKVHKIKQIEIMTNDKRKSVFAPSYTSLHIVGKDEEPNEGNAYSDSFGILSKSLQLTDYIRWELVSDGWDGGEDETFKSDIYSYTEGGFYGTSITQSVRLYDRHGDEIGTLPSGSRIFATMDLPFATGHEDETKIRIVGFNRSGNHKKIESVGTYFIDGQRNGRPTIETMRRDE